MRIKQICMLHTASKDRPGQSLSGVFKRPHKGLEKNHES
jgi:hypothetical protein